MWVKEKKAGETEPAKVTRFTKEQITNSAKFQGKADALNAILTENETYVIEDAEKKLEQFMKGKVK